MVDLSKAKSGDTVKFRCGGTAVIEKCDRLSATAYIIKFNGFHWNEQYAPDGIKYYPEKPHPMDITEVIPQLTRSSEHDIVEPNHD